jgi:DNA replication and repair protein RecF
VLAVGPNGAGKTNLLESLHVATQGFSPRTRSDAQLVRFGRPAARVTAVGRGEDSPLEIEVTVRPGEGKRARLNGALLPAAEQLRHRVAALVFTPDRLAVVKAGPAARRAYFDRVLGRVAPARAGLPAEYGAAVAQRNAALRRASAGISDRASIRPWTERVVELGRRLVTAREEVIAALGLPFGQRAEELGLAEAALGYASEPPSLESLEARLDRDLDRGVTGLGPHLDDVLLSAGARDLRSYGSQGEQRTCVLALLLAEAELLAERRRTPPLLLLDDVLSELDPRRRTLLAERLRSGRSQALITSTTTDALPLVPDQLLDVRPGEVTVR